MLRDAAVDLIQKRLGNNTDTTLRDDIINELVQAQATVCEGDTFKPWFLVSDETDLITIQGNEAVALPADFLAPWEWGLLYRYDVALDDPYVEMVRDEWDVIAEQLNYPGIPSHFDFAGSNLLMRPLSDAGYPLKWRYIARGATLAGTYGTNNVENVWLELASDWLIGEAGAVIAEQYLQMKSEKVDVWKKQAVRGRGRIQKLNVAMEEALRLRIMGE